MEILQRISWIEKVYIINLIGLLLLVGIDGGVSKADPLTYSVNLVWFVLWIVTGIPAVYAATYGLVNLGTTEFSYDAHTQRLFICFVVLLLNAAVLCAAMLPNTLFQLEIIDKYSLFS